MTDVQETNYMTKIIQYSNGHRCQPNNVGDYELFCPEWTLRKGVVPGFVPFMMRETLDHCEGCGDKISVIS